MIDHDQMDALNSMTKYPSIPTYHPLDERGRIAADAAPQVDFDGQEVVVTEKIDGGNGRIVTVAIDGEVDWIVGSREEWLTAMGDRVPNRNGRIVEALAKVMPEAVRISWSKSAVAVRAFYFEVYGAKIQKAAANYAASDVIGARLFDVAVWTRAEMEAMIARPVAEIARWRDAGGQRFAPESVITAANDCTPRVGFEPPPHAPSDVKRWLAQFATTRAALTPGAAGLSEGVVVRTLDRSRIAKIRFDDYRRVP